MKNLLQKSLSQLTVFSFVVFACSIPCYFMVVDWIWRKELDENNLLIAERIENEFNEQQISDEKLEESIRFWNEIQPVSQLEYTDRPLSKDSLYTITRENRYPTRADVIDRFRGLRTSVKINNRNYILHVETNVEEAEETVAYLALVTLLFFLILITGFWFLNRRLAHRLWQPFQDTLRKLKSFRLGSRQQITFQPTDTTEFAELNTALDRLLQHAIAAYNNQKEFTENASHELQTPLAILKNQLDILMQSDDLTEKQYHIIEDMNKALMRSSRINKSLLLLAKIENSQFDHSELIQIDTLLRRCMDELQQYFVDKNIAVNEAFESGVKLRANSSLTEVLINNLLLNAIRHTAPGGLVSIALSGAELEVRNSGKQALDSDGLFQRFAKLSPDTSGSGLGLSIVQQIVKLHGWKLSYRFENGEHVFSISLKF